MKHVTSLLTTLLAEKEAQPSRVVAVGADVTARTLDQPVHGKTVGGFILIR